MLSPDLAQMFSMEVIVSFFLCKVGLLRGLKGKAGEALRTGPGPFLPSRCCSLSLWFRFLICKME